MESAPPRGAGSGCLGRTAIGFVLFAGTCALGFLAGKYLAPEPEVPGPVAAKVEERVADNATVLLAVQNLARLETVAYHMERVIDLKQRQPRMFGLVAADDWILLIAVGDAVAGVDLSKMRDGDVIVDEQTRSLRLRLPPAELLFARLDNARTYVHTRKTDMMAERNDGIETRARQLGEDSIRQAALESGILERAARGAEQALGTLARSMGFTRVEFVRGER